MQIDQIDLAALAAHLASALEGTRAEGFVRGRTVLRDAAVARLACSELEAEELVDTMIGSGLLRYSDDPAKAGDGGAWRIDPTRPDATDEGSES